MASKEIEVLEPAATVETLTKIKSRRTMDRRRFMAAVGVAGAASGAVLASRRSAGPRTVLAGGPSQTDVLNFALNLEFLEATFYSYITLGTDLPGALTIGSGAITGNPAKLTFTGPNAAQITDMLNEIYYDELSHVKDLMSLLGTSAVARPAINLAAYSAITATNAIGIARLFEDVGVTAYAGAAGLLTGANLTYAAQILGTESFHAGAIRLTAIQNPAIAPYFPTGGGAASAGVATSFSFSGNTTAGSTTIANVYYLVTIPASPFNLVGQVINGSGIPSSGVKITAASAIKNTAITGTTDKTAVINTVSSVAGLAVGQSITGAGIPAGATITIVGTTTVTISAATTAAASAVAIAVGTSTITIAANAVSTSALGQTYFVGNADSADVAPYDPGTAALAAAGPTASGGFFATTGASNATSVNPAGTAFARTTSQVLAILYGAAGVDAVAGGNKGGFFPNGVNGVINTV